MVQALNAGQGYTATSKLTPDMISRPTNFTTAKPADATPAAETPKKSSHKFLKTIASLVATAIVVGGGLAYAAKTGKVKEIPNAEGLMQKAQHYAAKAGNAVNGWYETAMAKITEVFPKLAGKAEKAEA